MPKKGIFTEKGQKRRFLAKIPKNRDFRGFWAPWALPGAGRGGCFYINPSRRGPVALRDRGPRHAVASPGGAPIGARGGSPPAGGGAQALAEWRPAYG